MASSSTQDYVFEGFKVSIKLLQYVSNDLPAPASMIVGILSGIITSIDTLKRNREQCELLKDRLLRLAIVVMAIMKDISRGKTERTSSLDDLKRGVEQFRKNLESISEEVEKISNRVKSKRIRRKVVSAIFGESQSSVLQKCSDDLDWAMKEFEVSSHLADAVRLCQVLDKIRSILSHQLLHSLPRAKYAGFESERPDKPSNCFEGTRTGILNDINDWISNQDIKVQRIFWLSGIAGVGKTTVARTVAQRARDDGILGAQFFFSRRGEAELRDPRLVFPTIAYQLARFDPDFGERIIAALDADPDAAFGTLKDQLDKLIVEPLSHVERDTNRVVAIVFDAFDECEATGAKQILQLLIHAIPRLPFYLKILLTSRPERHIHSVLLPSNNLKITALHDIEKSIVTDDILRYLRHQLRTLPKQRDLDLPEDWITDEEIEVIADKAGNLFIHAATCLRFLEDAINLRKQLNILLKILRTSRRSSRGDQPFVDLDNLYLEILRGVITPRNTAEVGRLFQPTLRCLVVLRDALPVDALEGLTNIDTISDLLPLLASVILPPKPPDNCPRIYHPSFPDFLQDDSRCPDERFWVDTKKYEALMALRCLDLMGMRLHKGMLGNIDPALLNSEVVNLEAKVRAAFPPEMQYACRYWAAHFLAGIEEIEDPKIIESLDRFAARALLPWIEAMSWLGDLRLCLASLESINSWALKSSCTSLTKNLLNDAHRMLLAHFPTINLGAQHIERSAFPFLPRDIPLVSQYPEYTNTAATVLSQADAEWPACLMVLGSHSDAIHSVAFSPDGSHLASSSDDQIIHICDAMSGGSLTVLEGHATPILNIGFSPDGSQLASASSDCTIKMWDAASGLCTSTLGGQSEELQSICFSPDLRRIASASSEGTILRILDTSTTNSLANLRGHLDFVWSMMFSPDGSRLASGSVDRTARLWDAVTGVCLTTFQGHSDCVTSVAFFPDGSRLASGSNDYTVRIWDVATAECLVHLTGHSHWVSCVAISPDGARLASGSRDRTIRLWDTTSPACLTTLAGHSNTVTSVAFSPDGSRLASGSADVTVRIWDTSITDTRTIMHGHSRIVKSITFSPDGLHIASGSNDNTIRLWEAATGTLLAVLEGHTDWVEAIAFSPDGLHLASGSKDTNVHLWDTTTTNSITAFEDHSEWVYCVAFSPDGTKLASGSKDSSVRVYDMAKLVCLATIIDNPGSIKSVAFSPDGSHVVSGSNKRTVRVWDIAGPEGIHLATLQGLYPVVKSVSFSPSGSHIIARYESDETRVWDAKTREEVDAKAFEARTRTGNQLKVADGRLFRIDREGSKHLICIIPVSYLIDPSLNMTDFFVLSPNHTRAALGCESGEVLILDVRSS